MPRNRKPRMSGTFRHELFLKRYKDKTILLVWLAQSLISAVLTVFESRPWLYVGFLRALRFPPTIMITHMQHLYEWKCLLEFAINVK